MTEAIDQMGIVLRWEVLAQENKTVKEHRAKRKAARTKAEKKRVGGMGAAAYGQWRDNAANHGTQPAYNLNA